jgi:hypothetical protein
LGCEVFISNCQRKEITFQGGFTISDKAWKRFERRVASAVGGERIPINGRKGVDIKHPYLDIECKYRKSLPAWLFEKAWSQANEGDGIPTVVVGKHSSSQMFAITDLEYFVHIAELAEKYARDHDESD